MLSEIQHNTTQLTNSITEKLQVTKEAIRTKRNDTISMLDVTKTEAVLQKQKQQLNHSHPPEPTDNIRTKAAADKQQHIWAASRCHRCLTIPRFST
jgi:chorismate mutase